MNKYVGSITIHLGVVVAETIAEAREEFANRLENLAGSNDGSEALANSEPLVTRNHYRE